MNEGDPREEEPNDQFDGMDVPDRKIERSGSVLLHAAELRDVVVATRIGDEPKASGGRGAAVDRCAGSNRETVHVSRVGLD
jgi:hypothetical protein